MITVFSLGNAWKRSQLEIESEISYKILCEQLIPYQKEKLPDNVTFKVAAGKKTYDLIRLYESGEYFFSQKIIDILSQFVDMSDKCYPIKIEGVDVQYYVIYNLYAYPYLNKEKAMFEEEPPFFCGTKINTPLFSVTNTNRFVVTEEIIMPHPTARNIICITSTGIIRSHRVNLKVQGLLILLEIIELHLIKAMPL